MTSPYPNTIVGLLRIALGFTLFWAFLDKLFGLGFATQADKSWLDGTSPTAGFLGNAVSGPFAEYFRSLAGSAVVDWLFMLGLALIGLSLIFGVAMKIAGYSGALLMLLMWLALLPPKNNPILDEHIIYLLTFLFFARAPEVGDYLGLGKPWKKWKLIKKNSWLQ
ncbi:hypothetical protein COV82_00520 [Candidatus Peregrinibacteria bacterium CG11_big_fil_rev_8_21_14_0_20_46_8]|nr:MAG: hypothetical protein COV82_00520 [Candidatus Peregrinibacteria bacterium CG11_big_fil_rev_8_21_14_0_20_46_8]